VLVAGPWPSHHLTLQRARNRDALVGVFLKRPRFFLKTVPSPLGDGLSVAKPD